MKFLQTVRSNNSKQYKRSKTLYGHQCKLLPALTNQKYGGEDWKDIEEMWDYLKLVEIVTDKRFVHYYMPF